MSEINYNIILIGNSNCGKVIFSKKFINNKFYGKNISTIEKKTFDLDLDILNKEGISIHKKFVISFFDTGGQKLSRAIMENYFKKSDGIFLLYNIKDKSSFESVKGWIESINDSLDIFKEKKYALVLIGNKSDFEKEDILERQVNEYEAKLLCDEHDIFWGGEQNLKSLNFEEFTELLGNYVKEVYKRVGEKTIGKQKNNGIRKIQNIEKIETTAKEKRSRIKKNSCPSDVSDE